jgi:hypothetical protein
MTEASLELTFVLNVSQPGQITLILLSMLQRNQSYDYLLSRHESPAHTLNRRTKHID